MEQLNIQIAQGNALGDFIDAAAEAMPPPVRLEDMFRAYLLDLVNRKIAAPSRLSDDLRYIIEGPPLTVLLWIWIYGILQMNILYTSVLLLVFMVANPPIIWFIVSLALFCFKFIVGTYTDVIYRDQYSHRSYLSAEVALALFFSSLFGLVFKLKLDAGTIDDSWFDSWL